MSHLGRKYWMDRMEGALAEFSFGGGRIHRASRTFYLSADPAGSVSWGTKIAKIRWESYAWKVRLYNDREEVVDATVTERVEEVVEKVLPWAKKRMRS